MKSAGKARSNGLYRHIRTSKEIIRNLLNYFAKCQHSRSAEQHVLRAFGNHAASKRASVITKVPSFSE